MKEKNMEYMKQKLTKLKGQIDNSIIIVVDFNATLAIMDRTSRQKIKETEDLNNTANQLDIYRTLHPLTVE